VRKTVENKARALRLRAQQLRNDAEYRRLLRPILEKVAAVLDAEASLLEQELALPRTETVG